VFSLAIDSKVDDKGKAKAAYNKGLPSIAYVFDKDKNVILCGFLTDSSNTISVGTTAEALLYYGIGAVYQPYEVMEKFLKGIAQVPGVPEWKSELEMLFVTDPLMLKRIVCCIIKK